MSRFPLIRIALLVSAVFAFAGASNAQFKSQEVSEVDGLPVIVKHLPEWEKVRDRVKVTNSVADLRNELGAQPVLDVIELSGGAEAATAVYPEGKLLLIEFPTPQGSSEADAAIQAKLTENVLYRRIGNYNAFVFESNDPAAAGALLDQIKYEKSVQWLGEDPFFLQKFERYVAMTGRDVAISTVLFILAIFGTTILLGVATGFIYFRFREKQKIGRTAFSDAGGLTRLNLDELSE